MNKLKKWFKDLTTGGKVLIISLISLLPLMAVAGTMPEYRAKVDNSQNQKTKETKTVTSTSPVACAKEQYNDPTLAVGTTQVTQNCVNGEKTTTYTVALENNVEVSRVTASESVTTQPTTERTAIGTKQPAPPPPPPPPSCDSNYSGCVPIVNYDLDCNDIGFRVTVLGYDKHRFDGDRDGVGCESY